MNATLFVAPDLARPQVPPLGLDLLTLLLIADRMAAHRKSDQRRDDLCAGALRMRALFRFSDFTGTQLTTNSRWIRFELVSAGTGHGRAIR